MVKRKKLWEHIFFYSCLEWRVNYLRLRLQTYDLSRFNYSTFVILFLTSYFIVSKWWPMTELNKSYFFCARKFRKQQSSRDEVVTFRFYITLFNALHMRDVSHHVTWIGSFSKWPSIRRQKKFVENFISHNITLICSFRIL